MTINWAAVEACGTMATAICAVLALVRADQALRVARDSFIISSAIARGEAGAEMFSGEEEDARHAAGGRRARGN